MNSNKRKARLAALCLGAILLVPVISRAVDKPDIVDFWNGSAKWQVADQNNGVAFGFHFLSMIKQDGKIRAYYIAPSGCRAGVGRATSTDGLTWNDPQTVFKPVNCETMTFYTRDPQETDTSLFHVVNAFSHKTGRKDELTPGEPDRDDQAWSANVIQDDAGWLTYGPYYKKFPPGRMHATFRLKIDNNTADNAKVVELDVYDSTLKKSLKTRIVRRRDFESTSDYNEFHLNFTVPDWRHEIEFRTKWHDRAYIKQDAVMVNSGYHNEHYWGDPNFATFPGVFWDQQSGITYLAYEGGMGIGLAWSLDGEKFFRVVNSSHSGEIVDATEPYENDGLGTPTIFHKGDIWYLFYHVDDPQAKPADMYISVATGPSLLSLTEKHQVLFTHGYPNVSGAWDAGTVGKRSSLISGRDGYRYMAYEGSTEQVCEDCGFGDSNWSTGLARSKDLMSWEKYRENPILPQVEGRMGNDGPELIVIDGTTFLYVRKKINKKNWTDRYRLKWK